MMKLIPGAFLSLALALLLNACGGSGADPAAAPQPQALPALKADAGLDAGTAFRGHGIWWNPDAPGTGMFFEAQLGTGIVTLYVFDEFGRPTWFSGSGSFTQAGGKFLFRGDLQRFQVAPTGSPDRPATGTVIGKVSIDFEGDTARVDLPKRSFTARKFRPGDASRTGSARQPETGIYWNKYASGRGYTIEVIDGVATVAFFHYDTNGNPKWNLAVAPVGANGVTPYTMLEFAGGQTLDGAFVKAPTQSEAGTGSIDFRSACNGYLRIPGPPAFEFQRFSFAGLSERDACRAWSTLPGSEAVFYNSGTLPSTGLTTGSDPTRDIQASFGFGLPDVVEVTAFSDFSAKAQVQLQSQFSYTSRMRLSSGELPAGLRFDAETGVLDGTPTSAGESTFEVAMTLDRFGGQILDRQTIRVRMPLVSHPGYAGTPGPLWATSFEVDAFHFPRTVLQLRDPVTLHPLQLDAGTEVRFAVAEGSSLPPGLTFDPATNTVQGTPKVLAEQHDTQFEARFTRNGVTATARGTVPFRIHARGAPPSPGRVEYKALPVATSLDALQQQLNDQGAAGFRYLARIAFTDGRTSAVFVRDAAESFDYRLEPAAGDAITLQGQQIFLTGQAYRWGSAVGANYEYSSFVRAVPRVRWELASLHWNTTSTAQLVTRANEMGAQGFLYTGHRTFDREIVSMHERDTQSGARYEYVASSEDPQAPDFAARLNAQGAKGYRIRPVEVPPTRLAAGTLPPRLVLLEKDATQRASFHYTVRPVPANEAEFLAMAAEEGRTGGILAADYLHLFLPSRLVFMRPLQCQGTICKAAPFMPQ